MINQLGLDSDVGLELDRVQKWSQQQLSVDTLVQFAEGLISQLTDLGVCRSQI